MNTDIHGLLTDLHGLKLSVDIRSFIRMNPCKQNQPQFLMQPIIKQIHKLLIKDKKNIAVAESCTGGLLSNFLTQIPGSSQYFILGIVAYSNKTKGIILKIPAAFIAKYGAVSKEVASLMAQGIRKIAKTDFGIGITGIAGPTGGTPQKPVGTVFIAIDTKNKNIYKKFHFTGSRLTIRKKAALKALELLKGFLAGGLD